jgi:VWFA-related protein
MSFTKRLILVAMFFWLAVAPAGTGQDPQRPTFRTGTSLVRVDAYPSRNGKIIEGLTGEDFEVFEDGVLQKIDSFQFVRYERNAALGERRDPNSQRDGFRLAADPSYRVFVIYLDNLHVDFTGSHAIRVPLINFINRVLGTSDLFGVLTTKHGIGDLMLGQKTQFIEEQLTKYWDWGRGARVTEDEEDLIIAACFSGSPVGAELITRRRVDAVLSGLEGVMTALASMREERKNILLVSDGWPLPGRAPWTRAGARPRMPQVGVTDAGKLTMGRTRQGEIDPRACEEMLQRLGDMDFQQRFRDFLQRARQSNVTFYTIRPGGLSAYDNPASIDSLRTLSDQTDGIAVVNTNDLKGGAERIGDDLSAAYILGYYPANAKADGRVRKITVRLRGTKTEVRARREYRAPTEEEIASLRAATNAGPPAVSPVDEALAELKRLRPGAVLHSRATILGDDLVVTTEVTAPQVEAGRWKDGGEVQIVVTGASGDIMATTRGKMDPASRAAVVRMPLNKAPGPFNAAIRLRSATEGDAEDGLGVARPAGLLGDPLIFRMTTPSSPRPAGSVQFRRTERIQVRWPVNGSIDSREARVLGRDGVPLELGPALSDREEDGIRFVVADLNLAPLTAGEYIIEVKATAAGKEDSAHLAIRVGR